MAEVKTARPGSAASIAPDDAWLAKAPAEPILEPDLPIIDTHHHLWQRPDHRYLLHELLGGPAIAATTSSRPCSCSATRCIARSGPEEMRPVGETEFVAGIAAMSDSGGYGPTRVAAGIVGYADLTLGERVEAVLEAQIRAGGGRFRGVRHSGNWDADPIIGNGAPGPDVYRRADFRAGLARLSALGLSLDAWVFFTQLADVIDLARAFPGTNIIMGHVGGVLGYGPYAGRRDEIFAIVEGVGDRAGEVPERHDEAGRHDDAGGAVRLRGGRAADLLGGSGRAVAALYGDLHRAVRRRHRCMFESNFPVEKMGIGWVALWNAFKRIAAGASADEKRALFHDTAQRIYRLG